VAGGTSQRIDLAVRGTQSGTFVAAATLAASNDSNAQNNSANVSLTVGQSQTNPPPPSNGGGGGGAVEGFALLALLLAALRRLNPLTPTLSPKGRGGKSTSPTA
jgi:hypothetical protein